MAVHYMALDVHCGFSEMAVMTGARSSFPLGRLVHPTRESGDLRTAKVEEVGGLRPPTIRPHAAVGGDYFLALPFGFLPMSDWAAHETMLSASSSVMSPASSRSSAK